MTYGVVRAESAKASLNALTDSQRRVADELTMRLVSLVARFPERTYEVNGSTVYRHPDPVMELSYRIDEAKRAYVVSHLAAPLPPRVLLFVSYSHQNVGYREEFCKYAHWMQRTGHLSFWHDNSGIEPGDDWERAIRSAMKRSQAAVLLVSQDFLTSAFIRLVEIPTLLDRHEKGAMPIYWIPIEFTTIEIDQPRIYAIQALGNPKKPLAVLRKPIRQKQWVDIVTQLHRLIGRVE